MERIICPVCHLYTHQCSHSWDDIQKEWNRQGKIRAKHNLEWNLKNMKPRIVSSIRIKSLTTIRKHIPNKSWESVKEFFDDFYGEVGDE